MLHQRPNAHLPQPLHCHQLLHPIEIHAANATTAAAPLALDAQHGRKISRGNGRDVVPTEVWSAGYDVEMEGVEVACKGELVGVLVPCTVIVVVGIVVIARSRRYEIRGLREKRTHGFPFCAVKLLGVRECLFGEAEMTHVLARNRRQVAEEGDECFDGGVEGEFVGRVEDFAGFGVDLVVE